VRPEQRQEGQEIDALVERKARIDEMLHHLVESCRGKHDETVANHRG
jgi:hypothetical protein